jgi:hypothetical protein
VNNPYLTGLKTVEGPSGHVHGGPIPIGIYTIGKPEHNSHIRGVASRLTPNQYNSMMKRNGFLIHGQGTHGSDGCIVPTNVAEFSSLMHALTKDQGGTLTVLSSMVGEFG